MTLTDSGQELYSAIGPLMIQDAANGGVGAILCGAFATMLDPTAYVARDHEDGVLPGWAVVFDVANVQSQWLPWLGQFVGVSLLGITDVPTQRSLIENPVNFYRGRPSAIIQATQATLTGAKTVLFNQRTGGNPWTLSISTFTSQTPNPSLTANTIMSQMPAWLVPTIAVVTGGDYATLAASHASYTLMEAAHATYADIPVNPAA